MSRKTIRPFHIFKKLWNAFFKVIDYTQQREKSGAIWEGAQSS